MVQVKVTIPSFELTLDIPLPTPAPQPNPNPDPQPNPQPQPQPGQTARPAVSKGRGPFVVGSKLFDGNGFPLALHGTNKCHIDVSSPSLNKQAHNCTRWLADPDRWVVYSAENVLRVMQNPAIGGSTTGKAIQIPGFWAGTCEDDAAIFEKMVARWEADARKYMALERNMILNIANEWGKNAAGWRDAYRTAIVRLRAAGWDGCIMVDAPGCGQNADAVTAFGKDVLAADQQHNVLFSVHVYGGFCDTEGGVARQWAEQLDLGPTMRALRDSGLAVVIGEFGPGRGNIGESPTMITPQRIMSLVDQCGLVGELSWSWDNNNQTGGNATEDSFCHVVNVVAEDPALTQWGKIMVDRWNAVSKKATTFA